MNSVWKWMEKDREMKRGLASGQGKLPCYNPTVTTACPVQSEQANMSDLPHCSSAGCTHFASGAPDGLCNACRRGETPESAARVHEKEAMIAAQAEMKEVSNWRRTVDLTYCVSCGHKMTGCSGWKDGNPFGYSLMSCDGDEVAAINAQRVPCGEGVEGRYQYLCHLCGPVMLSSDTMNAWKKQHPNGV